jgi:hypothetical protein
VIFLQYISLSNVNLFPVGYFYGMFCASLKFEWCGIEEVGSGSFSYVKKDTKSKCRIWLYFFIKIHKQVIFQHECIVSPVQSASGKVLHCAWHFHRQNSSVLSYYKKGIVTVKSGIKKADENQVWIMHGKFYFTFHLNRGK